MYLADVHTHLDDDYFKDKISEVVDRASKAGVVAIISNGISPSSNRDVLKLSDKFESVKASLGIHPCNAMELSEEEIDNEINFIKENKDKIVAIGEVGLDYHWVKEKHDFQKKVFEKFIILAEELDLPIIVHTRKAELDCVEMLEKSKVKTIIMHCFDGKKNLIKRCIDNKWFFTVPTNIVRSMHFQNLVKEVNLSKLLTETDAPYLSPDKEKRNEPANVIETIKKIAEIKGLTVEETANIVFMNYKKVFR